MTRVQGGRLWSRGVGSALLAAALAAACSDDTQEPQTDPDGEVKLWPIPEVGIDAGRRRSDGGLGPWPLDAAFVFPRPPRTDSASDVSSDPPVMHRCGDGVVDALLREHCDDANDDDSDGCNNDCRVSARLLWSREDQPNVSAETLAVDQDGAIAIGGFAIHSMGTDLWVNKYLSDGTPAWPSAQTLDVGHDESASAIAFAPGGDIVVMGSTQVLGSRAESAILLMKYAGADGARRWAEPARAMAGPQHIGTTLLVSASEQIHALATFEGEGRLDVWLQSFDPMGGQVWPNPLQWDEGRGEFPGALWLGPDGTIHAYWMATPSLQSELVRADISVDGGSATTRHTALSEMGISNPLYFAVDPQGAVVVCANVLMGDQRVLWMQKFSFEGTPMWTKEVLEDAEETLQCAGVALDRTGNVAVEGALSGATSAIWLRLYAADGQPLWTAPVVYKGLHEAYPAGVGFDSEGNVVATGVRRTAQNYSHLWLAKYAR